MPHTENGKKLKLENERSLSYWIIMSSFELQLSRAPRIHLICVPDNQQKTNKHRSTAYVNFITHKIIAENIQEQLSFVAFGEKKGNKYIIKELISITKQHKEINLREMIAFYMQILSFISQRYKICDSAFVCDSANHSRAFVLLGSVNRVYSTST